MLQPAQILTSDFISNESDSGDGGAISVGNDTDLVVQDSTFIGNSAADHGGAIAYLPTFSQSEGISILSSTLISNGALRGGGLSVDDAGFARVFDSTLEDNVALYLDGGALRLTSVEEVELTRNLLH